jgi:hypothetical protein
MPSLSTSERMATSRRGVQSGFGRTLKWPLLGLGLVAAAVLTSAGYEVGAVAIGCNVKGNIGVSGDRIYHVPGQKLYSEARINLRKGERWFCSEEAARDAGWRKAKW